MAPSLPAGHLLQAATYACPVRTDLCLLPPTLQIHMVYSKRSGKPRGYAFIEYEHERDMHCEYLPPAPGPLTLSLLCCPSPFPSSVPHPLPARRLTLQADPSPGRTAGCGRNSGLSPASALDVPGVRPQLPQPGHGAADPSTGTQDRQWV